MSKKKEEKKEKRRRKNKNHNEYWWIDKSLYYLPKKILDKYRVIFILTIFLILSRTTCKAFMIKHTVLSFFMKNPALRLLRHGHMVPSNYVVWSQHLREAWTFHGRKTGTLSDLLATQPGTTSWRMILLWNSRPSSKKTPVYTHVKPTNRFIQPTLQELL